MLRKKLGSKKRQNCAPQRPIRSRINAVIRTESHWGREGCTIDAARIADLSQLMLLIGAGHQPGHPAPSAGVESSVHGGLARSGQRRGSRLLSSAGPSAAGPSAAGQPLWAAVDGESHRQLSIEPIAGLPRCYREDSRESRFAAWR